MSEAKLEPVYLKRFRTIVHAPKAIHVELKAALGEAWQPIETAPRDRWILVWRPASIVRDAAYFRHDDIEGWTEGRGGLLDPPPTHWMLPPEPPAEATQP
jgi:hypothetical protein